MLRRILGIVMIGLGLGCGTAQAHPHVFVTAAIAIRFDVTGKLTGVDETFTFDDVFSSFSTQGLDTNGDGKLSREELAPLATTNITAMKEFDYYTYASHGKDWRDFDDPKDYWPEDKNGVLVLHFFLPFKVPAPVNSAVVVPLKDSGVCSMRPSILCAADCFVISQPPSSSSAPRAAAEQHIDDGIMAPGGRNDPTLEDGDHAGSRLCRLPV